MGFEVIGIQTCKKVSADKSFVPFWAAIMDLQIALRYCILIFLILYLEEFSL